MKTQIEKQREALGLKVVELAQHLQIDSSLMSRILAGKREPSDQQLKKIAQLLSLDYNDLKKEKVANKVTGILNEYPDIAHEVMKVVEERVAYLRSDKRFEIISLSNLQSNLDELTVLQEQWLTRRPLDQLQLQKMLEYYHTQYTYESNQIEGNTLDFQETHLVVNEGITIGGKTMREHFEAINHQEAIALIVDLVAGKTLLSQHILLQLHQLILKGVHPTGAGKYRSGSVRITGSKHIPPEAHEVQALMDDYFEFYHYQKNRLHPVILAAEMHERLVSIHPFVDGNGRTSRLIMNLILLQHGYTIVSLKGDLHNRQRYYRALEAVQVDHQKEDFYTLIIEATKQSLEGHLSMC